MHDNETELLRDALTDWRLQCDALGWLPDATWAYSLALLRHSAITGDLRRCAQVTADILAEERS